MTDDRMDRETEARLADLFRAARSADEGPPADLLARVLADADAHRPVPAPRRRLAGVTGSIFRALGGWPAATGLVAASLVGVAIGVALPEAVPSFPGAGEVAPYDLTDLLPGYGEVDVYGG